MIVMMLINFLSTKQSYQNNVAVIGGAVSQNFDPRLEGTAWELGQLLLVRNKIDIV
jgi:hypothetical protein